MRAFLFLLYAGAFAFAACVVAYAVVKTRRER